MGYEVHFVNGSGRERKVQIREIKEKVKHGVTYDFLYSESSTMPTLLTEKHHFPLYPLLDFNFFKFSKQNRIPVMLYYRDMFWKFRFFRDRFPFLKIQSAIFFYKYDLRRYKNLVDKMYLPSIGLMDYLPNFIKKSIEVGELLPGSDFQDEVQDHTFTDETLNVLYIGGLGALYKLEKLFQAALELEYVRLIICCRRNEWEMEKGLYTKYLNDRVQIIHESDAALAPFYQRADVLSLFVQPILYQRLAMPIKLFEYLSFQRPIVGVKQTMAGQFIEQNDIGWTINYSVEEFIRLADSIMNDRKGYQIKIQNMRKILGQHTWTKRAETVIEAARQFRIK
jgi:glycosyltransferase involved in cell wall biosynthesis